MEIRQKFIKEEKDKEERNKMRKGTKKKKRMEVWNII